MYLSAYNFAHTPCVRIFGTTYIFRFAPLRRSLIRDTTHYLQGAAVLTGLLYNVDSRARLAGSGAEGD